MENSFDDGQVLGLAEEVPVFVNYTSPKFDLLATV